MRFFLLMAVYGVVAVVLESTWLAGLPSEMLRFDFIVIAVAALSFYKEWTVSLPVIVFFGIIMDVSSGGPFGLSLLSYLIIYGGMRTIIAKISFQAGLALLFWVAIISLMDKLIKSLILLASTGSVVFPEIIMGSAPAQALLDAVLALALMPFIKWYWSLSWEKITRPKGLVLK